MNRISKPTLLLDEDKCRNNIRAMARKAEASNVEFRPHFKTHQSLKVGEWCKEEGIRNITVSSIDMAVYFKGEFEHITIAIPSNLLESDRINELIKSDNVAVLADTPETIKGLGNSINGDLGVWIEIDTGSRRSGVDPGNKDRIEEMLSLIDSFDSLHFVGFYSHPGHTYVSQNRSEIVSTYDRALADMMDVKAHFEGTRDFKINIGDTPGCSTASDFDMLDSISPGNFVFYDVMQSTMGSCSEDQIGVCLACPIISKSKERNEWVIYGGGIHLSKDRITQGDTTHFGNVVELSEQGWGASIPKTYLRSISQEHGVVKVSDEWFDKYDVGDVIGVLPIHSCMTADCMGNYTTLSGESVDHMRKTR